MVSHRLPLATELQEANGMFTKSFSKNIGIGTLLIITACGGDGSKPLTANLTGTISNLKGQLTLEVNGGQAVTIKEMENLILRSQ